MASILALEYITSGFSGDEEDFRIAMEGYAMLKCLTEDIKASKHSITVMVHRRIQNVYPIEADRIVLVDKHENPYIILKKVASQFNYVITIAPAQQLPEIINLVGKAGGRCLGPCLEAVRTCSDKYLLYKALKRINKPTPKTVKSTFKLEEVRRKIKDIKPPFVVKPVDGVGCIGTSLVKDVNDLEKAVTKVKNSTVQNYFIIQEYINGINASACIIGNGLDTKILSVNRQYVTLKSPNKESSYSGGLIPIKPNRNIVDTLVETMKALKCLNGFIGVDFIISNNTPYITDVNPRITTSYIGLRKIINVNIPDTVIDGNINVNIECNGYAIIKKIKARRRIKAKTLDQLTRRDNIFINPMVVLSGVRGGEELALLIAKGRTIRDAEKEIGKLKLEVEGYFSSKDFIHV